MVLGQAAGKGREYIRIHAAYICNPLMNYQQYLAKTGQMHNCPHDVFWEDLWKKQRPK